MKTYPLLQSQLGVFYDCLKFPQVMQYNIPCITELTDDIDLDRVEQAIQTIFAKRPELRIRFLIDDNGEPRQYVDEAKQLTIVQRQMSETDFRQYAYHGFCRPFDIMGEEPLFRVELIGRETLYAAGYPPFGFRRYELSGTVPAARPAIGLRREAVASTGL